MADGRTTAEGIGLRTCHRQRTRTGLVNRTEAREDVTRRARQREIIVRVIECDARGGNRTRERDRRVRQADRIGEIHHVTVDELIRRAGAGVVEVQRRGIPGVTCRTRPIERTITELERDGTRTNGEGRGVTVARSTHEGEFRSDGIRRSVGEDREGSGTGRTVQEIHVDRTIDRQGTHRRERRGRQRVGLERRVVREGDALRRGETLEGRTGVDREVRVIDRTHQVQRTRHDRGRTGVSVRGLQVRGTNTRLGDSRSTRDDGVDVLRRGRVEGDGTATRGVQRTATREVILEGEATIGADRIERRGRARRHRHRDVDVDRSTSRQIADRTTT